MAKLRAVECREFIKAAVENAEDMGVPVSSAVAGQEGRLIALECMDAAAFITYDTAIAKVCIAKVCIAKVCIAKAGIADRKL